MKYTEEEWSKLNNESKGSDNLTKEIVDFMKKEKERKEQLPKQEEEVIVINEISDNEIIQQVDKVWMYTLNEDFMKGFESGAKWYRKQLKEK
jgi:hypothetical protein